MRNLALCTALIALIPGASAAQSGNEKAYRLAVRCFYANMAGASVAERQSQRERESTFRDAARRSYDIALKMGELAGVSSQQITTDLDAPRSAEPAKLMGDPDYLRDTVTACKALGLAA